MRGFTLLEVLLAIATLAILVGVSAPVLQNFQGRSDLDAAVMTQVATLRRAEELSRGISNDSQWGVKMATGTATLFKGSSFSTRDSSFDESAEISEYVSISGANEFVFSRLGATTTAIGTTTMLFLTTGDSRSITVNKKGSIEY